jgi:cytochrome c551/c552
MSRYRKFFQTSLVSVLLIVIFSFSNSAVLAATGEELFKANCAACHKPDADMTGPMLKGARKEPLTQSGLING